MLQHCSPHAHWRQAKVGEAVAACCGQRPGLAAPRQPGGGQSVHAPHSRRMGANDPRLSPTALVQHAPLSTPKKAATKERPRQQRRLHCTPVRGVAISAQILGSRERGQQPEWNEAQPPLHSAFSPPKWVQLVQFFRNRWMVLLKMQ